MTGLISQLNLSTSLLALLVFFAGATLAALIRKWPEIKALTISENERLRLDRREDYRELRREVEHIKARSFVFETHSAASDVRRGQVEFIVSMLLDEVERLDEGNDIAKRARTMFSSLYPVPILSEELEKIRMQLDPLPSQIPVTGMQEHAR